MAAKMDVQVIEMYCNLVREHFAPILGELDTRETLRRQEIEVEVKKELGIYDVYMEKAKLEMQLGEIDAQLLKWEDRNHTQFGYITPIDAMVTERVRKRRNGMRLVVEKARADMIMGIKLSGLDDSAKGVFDKLSDLIESFAKRLKELPSPKSISVASEGLRIGSKPKINHSRR